MQKQGNNMFLLFDAGLYGKIRKNIYVFSIKSVNPGTVLWNSHYIAKLYCSFRGNNLKNVLKSFFLANVLKRNGIVLFDTLSD